MMLDMKPNSSNFFIFIQNGHKAAELTLNISKSFSTKLLTNVQRSVIQEALQRSWEP